MKIIAKMNPQPDDPVEGERCSERASVVHVDGVGRHGRALHDGDRDDGPQAGEWHEERDVLGEVDRAGHHSPEVRHQERQAHDSQEDSDPDAFSTSSGHGVLQ
ncbi:MAG: hypothetical protein UT32_C0003G0026 [Parcubacteria group bacterium GW2011_GWC2_39_14]|nr:MAG: hypothetical protein UT32_C0003G0026 [Parcubacteria group bacterium GW2011_GWC2_39_14]KKR54975.1 MAG: hypothetical protein UT91_C0006G0026 [Parcubacteria group bacterium GW2011_GWA2_40_23]